MTCEVAVLLGYGKFRKFAGNLVRKHLNNIHIGLMRLVETQIQFSVSVTHIVFKCRSTPGIFRTVFPKGWEMETINLYGNNRFDGWKQQNLL